jgi:hypothetical protein
MKSDIQSIVRLELSGHEFGDLCSLIDHARYRIEDFIKELEAEKKCDASLVQSHKRLIQVAIQYTNLRAKL